MKYLTNISFFIYANGFIGIDGNMYFYIGEFDESTDGSGDKDKRRHLLQKFAKYLKETIPDIERIVVGRFSLRVDYTDGIKEEPMYTNGYDMQSIIIRAFNRKIIPKPVTLYKTQKDEIPF